MTKQEFQAMSLPYGLKLMQLRKHYPTPQKDRVVTLDGIADICGLLPSVIYNNEIINFYTVFYRVDESTSGSDSDIQFIPIVRPLESLTKECVQKDYNNGKPFVPIVELAKIAEGSDIKILDYKQKQSAFGVRYIDRLGDKRVFAYHKEASTFAINSFDYDFFDICMYQLQLFQQLLKWHFDLITEEYEKVYVTDEFNPYK